MERGAVKSNLPNKNKLPDAIYKSDEKGNFTQISNSFIRDSNLSYKAKMILILLLSNQEGWTTHLLTIQNILDMGRDIVENGISELVKNGYVKRIKYRDKVTKQIKGNFLAYTDIPFKFEYFKNQQILENQGLEIICSESSLNHRLPETPTPGESSINNIIKKGKNTNEKPPSGSVSINGKKYTCPNKWNFGFDFAYDKEGCMDCEDNDKHHSTYLACESQYAILKKNGQIPISKEEENKCYFGHPKGSYMKYPDCDDKCSRTRKEECRNIRDKKE